jgi:hypothetical protein
VKRAARAAGLDPKRFAGHSLRAGLATQVAKSGKNDRASWRKGAGLGARWSIATSAMRAS